MDKVGVIALVVVLGLGPATAHAAPPPASWGHDGYGPGNTRYNPAESAVNAAAFNRLTLRWTVTPAPGPPGCAPEPVAPLAVGGRVFLLEKGGVAAYSAATGKRLWLNSGFSHISTGPIVAGGLVLVADTRCESYSSYDGSLVALDAATGAQRWRRTAAWTIDTAVADAGTIVTSGSCDTCDDARHGVNAYRVSDGTPQWKHPNEVLAGPVSAGGTVLLRRTTGTTQIWAGRITTGAPAWGTDQASTAVAANPAGTQFYLRDDSGLGARSAVDGRKVWHIPKEAGDLAADGRRVYVASAGRVNTYDAGSGRLLWTRALATPRAPVRAGGLLYVLTGKGTLTVLSPADGKPISSKTAYSGLERHVVPAGGQLLTSQRHTVRAYAP
ncbi:PQQ-binding-like beta-propeller repeat protein [Actinoplanes sp. NEAU-A12]|uniref:PQQ-binding-like beta-propeller repeat protein n=1 Tax=Actinoplanes sandaracinus TaxID=3045177 RepID=A0ABT6WIL1_9ACTN|nr:PQQ-binding-like beta-propeller repeat protein [Actinoplanes sandaracinus]MDI6099570.1 PQQ-binding-like beta-propeller repeat protein [Actinoplanes sandaracinus]